jgi:hypothetical protein
MCEYVSEKQQFRSVVPAGINDIIFSRSYYSIKEKKPFPMATHKLLDKIRLRQK